MAKKKSKRQQKKENLYDEYGDKDLPYRTGGRAMKDAGVYQVKGRVKAARTVQHWIIRIFIIATIGFVCFALATALTANSRINSVADRVDESYSPQFKSRYESLGKEVIRAYFAHDPAPVNVMGAASWPGESGGSQQASADNVAPMDVTGLALLNGYQFDAAIDEKGGNNSGKDFFPRPKNEILTFIGIVGDEQYQFTVNFLIPDTEDPMKLPYLAAPPTITPKNVVTTSNVEADKPQSDGNNSREIELNQPSLATIEQWCLAWAGGDGDTLKRIAADGDQTHIYRGLGGFEVAQAPSVVWAYLFEDGGKEQIVARIVFSISRPTSNTSQDNPNNSGNRNNNVFATQQVMDVLLTDFEGGSPNLSAWGAGGTWNVLKPHMNATVIDPGNDYDEQQQKALEDMSSQTNEPEPEAPRSDDDQPSGIPGAPEMSEDETTSKKPQSSKTSSDKKSNTSKSTSGTKSSSKKDGSSKKSSSKPKSSTSEKTSTSN